MHRFWILSLLLAGVALIAPVAGNADERYVRRERRYYDKDGRDYHQWNDHENRAYRLYLGEQHRNYSEFRRERAERQREYFLWRHRHPDNTLFKLEIR